MASWIQRFKSLSGKLRPLAIEVAVFCCKNLGVPGGGLIADALGSIDKIRVDKEMANIDAVLQAVLAQGDRTLKMLEARGVAPAQAEAELERMMLQSPEARASIQGTMREIERIPDIMVFLQRDVREILSEVKVVHHKVDVLSGAVRQAHGNLGLGQQEIVALLLDLRKRLELRDQLRMQDSVSVRSESQRRQVHEVLAKVNSLPSEVRNRPEILAQQGSVLVAAGDAKAASRCFEQAQQAASDDKLGGTYAYNAFLAHLQAGELKEALARYLEAVRLNPADSELFDGDRYQPTGILGAGGFGIAFLCRNQVGERRVVKALIADGIDPENVFSEAEILRDITSEHVARVYEWGWADRMAQRGAFIVSEYAGDEDLADAVARRGPMPEGHAVPVMLRVAEGLAAAHARGVIHRDIKPANIMIHEREGSFWPKLIDFGLGLRTETLESLRRSISGSAAQQTVFGQEIAGTLAYAPPEQKGELASPVGPWSDVFAFGRAACFILFGTAQPLRSHWQTVSDALGEVLEKCQARQPRDRYQSFTEVIASLHEVQAASSHSGPIPRPSGPQPPTAHRPPPPPAAKLKPARPVPNPKLQKPQGKPAGRSKAMPWVFGCGCLVLLVVGISGMVAMMDEWGSGGGSQAWNGGNTSTGTSQSGSLLGDWRAEVPESFGELYLFFGEKGNYRLETYTGGNFTGNVQGYYTPVRAGVVELSDEWGNATLVEYELSGNSLTLPIVGYGYRTFFRQGER